MQESFEKSLKSLKNPKEIPEGIQEGKPVKFMKIRQEEFSQKAAKKLSKESYERNPRRNFLKNH